MSLTHIHAKIRTITKEELLRRLENKEPVHVINVLSPEHYGLGFIPGSQGIPLNELDYRLDELNPNKEIVTYCAGYDCPASMKAAEKLSAKGFNAVAYEGGIKEWGEAGFPLERP